jgi:two-component system LytT family response regulator
VRLKALLADDEFPARDELKYLLEEIGGIDVVAECEDGSEVLEVVRKADIDVAFLDIHMRTRDGLSTAAEMAKIIGHPKVVFTTGYSEYAVKAFDLDAVDYVVKPYSRKRVEKAVAKLFEMIKIERLRNVGFQDQKGNEKSAGTDKIAVWANDRMIMLNHNEIFFVQSLAKRKTLLCTEKGKFTTSLTLKDIQNRLEPPQFIRTHKSYIVNLQKIREVIPWFNNTYVLNLEGCSEKDIPVSRHFIKEFNSMMGI